MVESCEQENTMNEVSNAIEVSTISAAEQSIPAYNARQLTQENGQARIVLDGQVYSLRITRANKLILTK